MKFWQGLLAFCLVLGICPPPARAISTPQEASTEYRRINREFEDFFENPNSLEPGMMATLLRRLNELSLYLWDQAAGEVELALPASEASTRLATLLAATNTLQNILALSMLPERTGDKHLLKNADLVEALTRKLVQLNNRLEKDQ